MIIRKNTKLEIIRAKKIFIKFKRDILEQKNIVKSLKRLEGKIQETSSFFKQTGVQKSCFFCFEEGKGPCCFDGAQWWYDLRLLLINQLLGVNLPEISENSNDCWFNSSVGCKLLVKDSICLNFFCPEIIKSLSNVDFLELRRTIGRELSVGLELESKLLPFLQKNGISWI